MTLDQGLYYIDLDGAGADIVPSHYSLRVTTTGTLLTRQQYNDLLEKPAEEQAALDARAHDQSKLSHWRGQVKYWTKRVHHDPKSRWRYDKRQLAYAKSRVSYWQTRGMPTTPT